MTHRLPSSLRLIPCILRPVSPSLRVIICHFRGLFSRESCDRRHSLTPSHALLRTFISFFNLFSSLSFLFSSLSSLSVSLCHRPSISADIPLLRVTLRSFAGNCLCKCACLTFLLRPIYVTQAAECEVSVSETDS